jgi:very-short-patch-repair endonuclease
MSRSGPAVEREADDQGASEADAAGRRGHDAGRARHHDARADTAGPCCEWAARAPALEASLDRSELLRLLDFADLQRLLARYPGRPGSSALVASLSRHAVGSVETRSVLEELVLELCDNHGLPRPKVNCSIEGKVRDFHWPGSRLVVEADPYAWHRSPSALSDDRERDVGLTLAGYRSLRFTWEQVTRRREYVAGALLRALATS